MKTIRKPTQILSPIVVVLVAWAGCDSLPHHEEFGEWSVAQSIEIAPPGANANFNIDDKAEGCPFVSADGKKFFIMSTRDGGEGGQDIWISTREHVSEPWGEPQNAGPEINSPYNDFCPTLARDGHTFYFASNRPGYCGEDEGALANSDIYRSRMTRNGFEPPEHLGCKVNSNWDEHSPFPMTIPGKGQVLFFSSAREGGPSPAAGDHDIYVSRSHRGVFGPADLVDGVNTESQDGQPNVRRDGLEIFFYSNRPGSNGHDIHSASRNSVFDDFSTPVNLGTLVNGDAVTNETRPSLSWDGHTLYFGSSRSGAGDIYVTTR